MAFDTVLANKVAIRCDRYNSTFASGCYSNGVQTPVVIILRMTGSVQLIAGLRTSKTWR